MSQIIQLTPAAAADRGIHGSEPHNPAIHTGTIYVVFTSIDDTIAAVRVAGDLAKSLDVPVTLVHFRTVRYALPVDEPGGMSPVETDAFIERLQAEGIDIRVRVDLCRDRRPAIPWRSKPIH